MFLLFAVLVGVSAFISSILLQYRKTARSAQYFQDLCELQQNSLTYYRQQAQIHTASLQADLVKANTINEDLLNEMIKLYRQNSELRKGIETLQEEIGRISPLMIENFELRDQNYKLQNLSRKLRERNLDLEYAINLESISMLEAYEEQNKLYSVINDVRRSLVRILNPA